MINIDKRILDKTLFIVPELTFSSLALVASGLNVLPPYKFERPIILRIIRELFFRLKLPYRKWWFYPVNKKYEIYFIYDGISPEYVEWLHRKYPESLFIMCYMNVCSNRTRPSNYKFDYLHLWSGDANDCNKYDINFIDNFGAYSKSWIIRKSTPKYDVFFVGKDKGKQRLNELLHLKKVFHDMGLKTYFHIVGDHRYDRFRNIHYKRFMPYNDCLNYLGKTKAILYLGFGSQETITIRIQESLIHKIKLITDCIWIKKYDFYDKDNIFIIGEDKFQDLPNFLNSPYKEVNGVVLKHMFIEDLATEIISRTIVNVNNNTNDIS